MAKRISNNENIKIYLSYFSKQIDLVDLLESKLFKKILFSIIIDTISHTLRPKERDKERVGERITNLIDKYSGWLDKDRISIPQLSLMRIPVQRSHPFR